MRFILVEKILELQPGERIRASKQMAADEDFFQDHFPGFPVVPGVLLTEMMAQAAGKCLDAEKKPRGKAMLAKITSASFRDWVRPDEDVIIHAEIRTNRDTVATANCYIEVGGKKVSSAELLFSFVPMERFAPGYVDEVLEAYLGDNAKPFSPQRHQDTKEHKDKR
jgi:3-hydroxyacyl-[acyl-carrier-protein] dehydratase